MGLWTLRIALVAWLMSVENPFGLAGAMLVLTVQFPIQRAVLAWGQAEPFPTGLGGLTG